MYYSVWVSPKCPLLPADKPDSDGSGPTDFKCSLQTYLKSYNIPCLNEWIERVKRADFSDVKYGLFFKYCKYSFLKLHLLQSILCGFYAW